jgi:hypothetical protein
MGKTSKGPRKGNKGKRKRDEGKRDDGPVDMISVVEGQRDEDDQASDNGDGDVLQMLKNQQEVTAAQIIKVEAKISKKAAKKGTHTRNPKQPTSSPAATGSCKPKASPTATGM